jgi:NAD(P)-dependent dehydrogenase (short-subunit alcohol dehydrogenase family)
MTERSMKRIIITGSRGLIGATVKDYLESSNYQILELDLVMGHDLTDESFVKLWFSKNKADGLINLFALNDHIEEGRTSNRLMDLSLEVFNKFLQINIVALFSVCREFARSNESGAIVNFSSTYGLVSPNPKLYEGSEKNIAYVISKAAAIQMTRHLAVHLAPKFRVNCVVPGGVKYKQSKEFQDRYGYFTPMGRMMNVEEICGIVEFLVSEKSTYCTGGVFPVDGGWTTW